MPDTNKNFSQDEDLSDFTDRVLNSKTKITASDANEELRGLEETILRLHNSMPSSSLEESTKKQMLVRLNARIKKEQPQKKSFWASLFNSDAMRNQSRTQFIAAVGMIGLLIVAVILSPALGNGDSTSTVGAAFKSNSSILIVVGLAGVVVGILWSIRRK